MDQLTRPVPGGIGVYIAGVLQGLTTLGLDEGMDLLTSRTALRLGLDRWRGSRLQAHFGYRLQQRLWDHSGHLPRGNWAFYHAFSLGGPRLSMPIPKAVAVYDLLFRTSRETFPTRARDWHERRFEQVLESDSRIVTLAPETVDLLVEAGAAMSRITVIPPGVDHVPPVDTQGTAALLDRLGVTGRYLMVLGTLEPRKNLPRILSAYQQYRATAFDPPPLLIVGPMGWGQEIVPPRGVSLTGKVSAGVVAGLLARAWALIYVPLQEGFGLPVIEAMSSALPVVTSAGIPAARFGGLGVEPTDVDAIASAIARIVEDEPLRSRLVTHGLLAVEGLSWVEAARKHVQLWEELAK
ncbi:glycosyltransferase family 1 protein [Ferrimicrobium sp.]|uniref:glycosyltransferase family 4 protein n=1 Tax=Ferrimicrobium sp. TaxID=2926050 RepID=UPI0026276B17|nr:glycosyltransferase family 1 protein [Ferrimicrobium sp.]